MLEKLFSSGARLKLLKLFLFAGPEDCFYIRQLSRELDLQLNSVRRELTNLEEIGLLEVKTDRKQKLDKKFYQVNQSFYLLSELRALLAKAEIGQENKLLTDIKKLGAIDLLIMTGFFTNDQSAPTDLLIVSDHFNKTKLNDIIKKIEQGSGRSVRYTLMDQAEFSYRQSMADIFLYQILNSQKEIVVNKLAI
ncbi:hypothetical protein EOM71_03790 [Candidatus Falkowbacteria bacterium]|nr:hypothetical protein [Candidatus Falkowbacteria bacterium]